jgi:hypothetical protein
MGSSSDFDFWLGEWRVTWNEGRAQGRNSIAKEYGGNVVYERFDGRPGIDLVGMSISVYRDAVDRWFQTWVDDSGNYFALQGGMKDGEMVLLGELSGPRGRVNLRMRFSDIEDDRLTWRWESSKDNGATWEQLWELAYERAS